MTMTGVSEGIDQPVRCAVGQLSWIDGGPVDVMLLYQVPGLPEDAKSRGYVRRLVQYPAGDQAATFRDDPGAKPSTKQDNSNKGCYQYAQPTHMPLHSS